MSGVSDQMSLQLVKNDPMHPHTTLMGPYRRFKKNILGFRARGERGNGRIFGSNVTFRITLLADAVCEQLGGWVHVI